MMRNNSYLKQYGDLLAERDGYVCHYCGKHLVESEAGIFNEDGACVDHVIAQSNGGTDDPSNLVLACRGCNGRKRTKHYQEFRFQVETDGILMFLMGEPR